jgi:transposase
MIHYFHYLNESGDFVADIVETLVNNNAELVKQLTEVNKKNEQLQQQITYLNELISEMNRKLFGKSKEVITEDGQLSLFEEAVPSAPINNDAVTEVSNYKRKSKGTKADKLAHFPTEIIEQELTHDECNCENCGNAMIDMGSVEARSELNFIPAVIKRRIYRQHSYVCKSCERKGITSIKKASVPKPLISNSLGSSSIVAETIIQKFQQKVPAYRQEKYWQSLGLEIKRDNIRNWQIISSEQVLRSIYDMLHEEIIKQDIIHADETSYQVIQSNKVKTYYWQFCSGKVAERQIVLYHHAECRGHEVPLKFLDGFTGYLNCDGWGAYHLLPNITLVACAAHIRRKFYEAIGNKKNPNQSSPAYVGYAYWQKMFQLEKRWRDLVPSERFVHRQSELKPIMDEFWQWLENLNALPHSKLGRAAEYAAKQRHGIMEVLNDGRLEFSNNKAERMIKELVMGRKNWLFSTSLKGAQSNGIILSIMKTAELQGLNVRKYLNFLFTEIPNLAIVDHETLADYVPWSAKAQLNCK